MKTVTVKLGFVSFKNLTKKQQKIAIKEYREDEKDLTDDEVIAALNDCIFNADGNRIKPNTKLILR